jgi:hypothetical protein
MPIGAAAISAHVLAKWVPYYLYRRGRHWPNAPVHLMRLLFLGVLWMVQLMAEGPDILANWTALALLGFTLFKARRELIIVVAASRRLDHPVRDLRGDTPEQRIGPAPPTPSETPLRDFGGRAS